MEKIIASPGAIDQLNEDLFIIQNGDTADQAIASGEFVKWKGVGYVANTAISVGGTLSGNLTALSKGALNSLNSKIVKLNHESITFDSSWGLGFMSVKPSTSFVVSAATNEYPVGLIRDAANDKWVLFNEELKGQTKDVYYAYISLYE